MKSTSTSNVQLNLLQPNSNTTMTLSGPTKPSPRPKKARSSLSASRPSFRGTGRPPRPPAAPAAALFTTAPSSATTPLFPASTTDAASVLPLFAPSPVAPTTFAVGSPNRGVAGYYNAPLTPTASFTAPPAEYRTPQHVAGNSPHGSHGLEYMEILRRPCTHTPLVSARRIVG